MLQIFSAIIFFEGDKKYEISGDLSEVVYSSSSDVKLSCCCRISSSLQAFKSTLFVSLYSMNAHVCSNKILPWRRVIGKSKREKKFNQRRSSSNSEWGTTVFDFISHDIDYFMNFLTLRFDNGHIIETEERERSYQWISLLTLWDLT